MVSVYRIMVNNYRQFDVKGRLHSMAHTTKKLGKTLPVTLFLDNFKSDREITVLWVLITLIILDFFGSTFGFSILIVHPIYLGKSSFMSFFLSGLGLSILIYSYHTTKFILHSHEFPFLGMLQRPFTVFVLNNSILPLVIVILYFVRVISESMALKIPIGASCVGFLSGLLVLIPIAGLMSIRSDVLKFMIATVDQEIGKSKFARNKKIQKLKKVKEGTTVERYLSLKFKWRSTETLQGYYNRSDVLRVFDKSHFRSVMFELGILVLMVILTFFADIEVFQIPVAALFFIASSVYIFLVSAIYYWFRIKWISKILGVFFTLFFYLNNSFEISQAHGLEPGKYYPFSVPQKKDLAAHHKRDSTTTINILENWKQRNLNGDLPKMIFISSEGGGKIQALWSFRVLQYLDSITAGEVMRKNLLITGKSAGLLGLAFYRELYLLSMEDSTLNRYDQNFYSNMKNERINELGLYLVKSRFLTTGEFEWKGYSYRESFGIGFEKILDDETSGLLAFRTLRDYSDYERHARIPIFMCTNTLPDFDRKLFIGSQPMSYMADQDGEDINGLDLKMIFGEDALDLRFLSILRMNIPIPGVQPSITFPTDPQVTISQDLLDDRFGIKEISRFTKVFQDWINTNTSGVIILSIRNSPEFKRKDLGQFSEFIGPIIPLPKESFLKHDPDIWKIQNRTYEDHIELIRSYTQGKIEVFEFFNYPVSSSSAHVRSGWSALKGLSSIDISLHDVKNMDSVQKLLSALE